MSNVWPASTLCVAHGHLKHWHCLSWAPGKKLKLWMWFASLSGDWMILILLPCYLLLTSTLSVCPYKLCWLTSQGVRSLCECISSSLDQCIFVYVIYVGSLWKLGIPVVITADFWVPCLMAALLLTEHRMLLSQHRNHLENTLQSSLIGQDWDCDISAHLI